MVDVANFVKLCESYSISLSFLEEKEEKGNNNSVGEEKEKKEKKDNSVENDEKEKKTVEKPILSDPWLETKKKIAQFFKQNHSSLEAALKNIYVANPAISEHETDIIYNNWRASLIKNVWNSLQSSFTITMEEKDFHILIGKKVADGELNWPRTVSRDKFFSRSEAEISIFRHFAAQILAINANQTPDLFELLKEPLECVPDAPKLFFSTPEKRNLSRNVSFALFGGRRILAEYQLDDFLQIVYKNTPRAINWEMGTGKTTLAFALILFQILFRRETKEKTIPAIAILPLQVLRNWTREAIQYAFCPSMWKDIYIFVGEGRKNFRGTSGTNGYTLLSFVENDCKTPETYKLIPPDALLILTTFDVVTREKSTSPYIILKQCQRFSMVIVDEAHKIRGSRTSSDGAGEDDFEVAKQDAEKNVLTSKSAKAIIDVAARTELRFALSGTLFVNSSLDLLAIVRFLNHGRTKDNLDYLVHPSVNVEMREKRLKEWRKEYMMIRGIEEVAEFLPGGLPPKYIRTTRLVMGQVEREEYNNLVSKLPKKEKLDDEGKKESKKKRLTGEEEGEEERKNVSFVTLRQQLISSMINVVPELISDWFEFPSKQLREHLVTDEPLQEEEEEKEVEEKKGKKQKKSEKKEREEREALFKIQAAKQDKRLAKAVKESVKLRTVLQDIYLYSYNTVEQAMHMSDEIAKIAEQKDAIEYRKRLEDLQRKKDKLSQSMSFLQQNPSLLDSSDRLRMSQLLSYHNQNSNSGMEEDNALPDSFITALPPPPTPSSIAFKIGEKRISNERLVVSSESKQGIKLIALCLANDGVRRLLGVEHLPIPQMFVYTGDVKSNDDRNYIIDRFIGAEMCEGAQSKAGFEDGRSFVFLMTRACGGIGLNLCGGGEEHHGARLFFSVDSWWNEALGANQSQGRVWRIGQKRPTYCFQYENEGTPDEYIGMSQTRKQQEHAKTFDDEDEKQDSMNRLNAMKKKGVDKMLQDKVGFLDLVYSAVKDNCNTDGFRRSVPTAALVEDVQNASTSQKKGPLKRFQSTLECAVQEKNFPLLEKMLNESFPLQLAFVKQLELECRDLWKDEEVDLLMEKSGSAVLDSEDETTTKALTNLDQPATQAITIILRGTANSKQRWREEAKSFPLPYQNLLKAFLGN